MSARPVSSASGLGGCRGAGDTSVSFQARTGDTVHTKLKPPGAEFDKSDVIRGSCGLPRTASLAGSENAGGGRRGGEPRRVTSADATRTTHPAVGPNPTVPWLM
jgi:hypothetical protein